MLETENLAGRTKWLRWIRVNCLTSVASMCNQSNKPEVTVVQRWPSSSTSCRSMSSAKKTMMERIPGSAAIKKKTMRSMMKIKSFKMIQKLIASVTSSRPIWMRELKRIWTSLMKLRHLSKKPESDSRNTEVSNLSRTVTGIHTRICLSHIRRSGDSRITRLPTEMLLDKLLRKVCH